MLRSRRSAMTRSSASGRSTKAVAGAVCADAWSGERAAIARAAAQAVRRTRVAASTATAAGGPLWNRDRRAGQAFAALLRLRERNLETPARERDSRRRLKRNPDGAGRERRVDGDAVQRPHDAR